MFKRTGANTQSTPFLLMLLQNWYTKWSATSIKLFERNGKANVFQLKIMTGFRPFDQNRKFGKSIKRG